ncbi:SIR2 family protein [Fibrella arboris]|uniref:SIR2 family protein n=1 Tax=Fibrella arboris TaxID=3242486 RepID=UPI00352248DD
MTTQQESFINDYLKHLINGDAAIFAGAGLSVGAGYVDWRGLLREIAQDLDLEIDKESDLISLAQFHVNERGGRGRLNQKIIEEFTEKAELTENHKILARLPIRTFWTTNYDSLLEDSLEESAKRVDVKHTPSQLANPLYKREAVVYKMHGDAKHPQHAILTKDDYEQYHRKHEGFITTLSSDLISKTFLFLGFSFTDPNLDYVLSRVKLFLDSNSRPHYCIIRKVNRRDFKDDAEHDYATRRQSLMISDLKRFQIQTVAVEEYSEITDILLEIEKRFKQNTVFISGSAADYTPYTEQESLEFVHSLSKDLIKQKYSVVNGFGLGIGSAVINGALEAIYSSPKKYNEDQLIMRPFPQVKTGSKDLPELWHEYRQRMISFAGISIFVFGNKIDRSSGNIVLADGVKKEFDIAISQGVLPIAVGVTGSVSHNLWEEVKNNFDTYYPSLRNIEPYYLSLGDPTKTLKDHIKTVLEIIKIINGK